MPPTLRSATWLVTTTPSALAGDLLEQIDSRVAALLVVRVVARLVFEHGCTVEREEGGAPSARILSRRPASGSVTGATGVRS